MSIDNIDLSTFLETLRPIMHNMQQLCGNRTARNKCKFFGLKNLLLWKRLIM